MTLSENETRIFNSMREGILIIDTDGIIVFGNDAYRRFLNLEAGGDVGRAVKLQKEALAPGPEILKDILKPRIYACSVGSQIVVFLPQSPLDYLV